jgi:acetyl-CoA carboxylase beta subunit
MAWFKKARKPIASPGKTSRVPEGLWVKCPECDTVIYTKDLIKNLHVCGKCAHHFPPQRHRAPEDALRRRAVGGDCAEPDRQTIR